MKLGATISQRELSDIRGHLDKIAGAADDRKVREKVRMIRSVLNKAERRSARKASLTREAGTGAVEIVFDPNTREFVFKD